MIVTVWIKDLEIKVAFGDTNHIMTKICNNKEELESTFETVQAICHSMGTEIELK